MPSYKKKKGYTFNKFRLSYKLAGTVLLLGFFVLIPSVLLKTYSSLAESKNDFNSYKHRVETRIKKGLEPVIWNYDIDALREIISAELVNDNLKSVKISTPEEDIIWLTSSDGKIIDEYNNLEGKYLERHVIPIYRLDYKEKIIAYATIWYDLSASRDVFFERLTYDFIFIGGMLLVLTIMYIISSHIKLAKPLEAIKEGMIAAGKSSFIEAKKKMNITNFKGSFSEVKGLHRDIENMFDEIEMANCKLLESEAEFRAIFHQAGIGVAQVKASSAECIIANKKYGDILGLTSDELINLSLIDLTYGEDKEPQKKIFNKLFAGELSEVSMEKRYRRKDGKIVWVALTVSPLYKPGETPTSHIAVIQDITDKKIAEERLRRLNDELEDRVAERTIDLENANCELEAAIEDLRSVQTQLINKEKMAVLGQLVAGIAHELNTPLGIINSMGGTLERIIQNETYAILKFNKTASEDAIKEYKELVRNSIEAIRYQDSSNKREMRRRYSAIDREDVDVSDEIVEKLVELGYDKNSNEFIKLVKEPENHAAITNAYNTATIYKSVKMIISSTERASKVIMALRTYSHKDTDLEIVPHDVVEDIEMVLTLLHNQIKYGIEIIREYKEVPKVLCVPDRLHQIWVNIINNAIQAMDCKGVLTISVSQIGSRVKVSITDNGPGISDAVAGRVFEPFFSTKKLGEGTGLGLDIVKRILNEVDGSIDFQTRPGKTTFNVWLEAQKE